MDSRHPRRHRPPLVGDFRVEATAFLYEIIRAADCLRDASTFEGASAMQLGPRWRLLRAIERCGGAPTFSDLGRLLDMSRQGAREQALEAAEAGVVDLFPAHDDRRALQVMLTPAGRRALDAPRMPEPVWLFTLLNGLEPAAMRSTHQVLRVLRLRLERYAGQRRRAQR